MNKCWQHANSGIQDFAVSHISFICFQIEENKAIEQAVDYWIPYLKAQCVKFWKAQLVWNQIKKYAFI